MAVLIATITMASIHGGRLDQERTREDGDCSREKSRPATGQPADHPRRLQDLCGVTILAIGRKAAKALEREAVLFASSRRVCSLLERDEPSSVTGK
jgi:hypothetical protein